jgi:hypothetical protein
LNFGIHLVSAEHLDISDAAQVDREELSCDTCVGNSKVVIDLILVDGRYVAVEHLDDGDGPLVEED